MYVIRSSLEVRCKVDSSDKKKFDKAEMSFECFPAYCKHNLRFLLFFGTVKDSFSGVLFWSTSSLGSYTPFVRYFIKILTRENHKTPLRSLQLNYSCVCVYVSTSL